MNALTYGFELAFVGFSMVIITLFILAMILKLFNRFLAPAQKPVQSEAVSPPPSTKEVTRETEAEKKTDEVSLVIEAPEGVKPEIVAAISGAIRYYLEETAEDQQYIAAAIAALKYAMPAAVPQFKVGTIDRRISGTHISNWAQVGRKRSLYRRQDIALLRRRKLR